MTFYDKLKTFMFADPLPYEPEPPKVERKTDILQLLRDYTVSSTAIGTSFRSLATEGYMANPDVFACVREIATAVRGIPFVVQTTNAEGEVEVIRDHPMLKLLNKPNNMESGSAFREHLVTYHLVGGRAYVLRVGATDLRRPPLNLYLLRPDTVMPIAGTTLDMPISAYQYSGLDGTRIFPREQILDLPYFNMIDATGSMSPLNPAATSVDAGNLGRTWNKNLIQNGARPPSAVETDTQLTDDQFDRLKAEIEAQYSGVANSGKPALLEGGLKWKGTGLSPADMEWQAGQRMSTVDICRVFNVAPELVGDSANKTYCLPAYSRIMTPDGSVNIVDLREGDVVYCLIDDEIKTSVVTKQGQTGVKPLLKINAGGRELICTDNHPVLVRESKKIPAPMVGNRHSQEIEQQLTWKNAGELKIGDVVLTAYEYPESGNPVAPREVNADLMEFLGAMLGDGFAHDYGTSTVISFAGNKGAVRDWHLNFVQSYFVKPDGQPVKIQELDREFRFSSKSAVEFLELCGVTGKAGTKRIPSWVFTQPREMQIAFLRGLFDTDGSVSKKGHIKFSVKSEMLAKDARDLSLKCGIAVSAVKHAVRMTKLPNGEDAVSDLWTWTALVPSLNLEIGARCPIDMERLQTSAQAKTRGRRNATEGNNHALPAPKGTEYVRIKSIESLDAEPVYDIEVAGAHCFFAEHILVHNSNYKEARVALYQETVLPLLDYICDEFNSWLTPLYGEGIALGYDIDNIEALQENRDAVYTRLKDAWWLSPNERRLQCGIETSEDPLLDKYYVPSNLVPIELSGTISQNPLGGSTIGNSTSEGGKSYNCSHETKMLPPMTKDQEAMSDAVKKALAQITENAVDVIKE